MSGRKKTAPETVEAEIVNEVAVAQPAKMEFRLINPTEDGFLRVIKWNKEELETAVRQKIAAYENVVYTEDNIRQAKADRAELNKLTKAIEARRKMVKKIINEPYDKFEAELKEVLALIQKPVGIIDEQVKAFEDRQKEDKKAKIREVYDEIIGNLASVLPFEKVFDSRYLNQTYKLNVAQQEVREKIQKVKADLEIIDSLESKYKLNAKDVYIKTLDLSKALAENKRLSDLEKKLEAEKRRKAEEEEEKKRLEEERRKVAEEKAKAAEEEHKTQERVKATITPVVGTAENVSILTETVTEPAKNGTEAQKNVINSAENETNKTEGRTETVSADNSVVDPFAPKQEEEKKYRTRFCAIGTREQLRGLINYMKENYIEYGRI